MKKLLFLASLIATRLIPIIIIFTNHLIEVDGGINLTLIGWGLATFVIYFLWYRPLAKEVDVWKIQKGRELFVINFHHIKVLAVLGLTWLLFQSIGDNILMLQTTLFQIAVAYAAGWVIRVFSL